MKVVVIGGGGREHALARALSRSAENLAVTPGNAGTQAWPPCDPGEADLVVVGPEAPLAEGLADRWPGRVFGPSARAAEIESSKAFAKAFMGRHGIPTAEHACFTELEPALRYARGRAVVIKASGLAAGKGVILPAPDEVEATLRRMLVEREFGEAGAEVVIEERLEGPEVSVLAFTDGHTIRLLPAARDHKRLLTGDLGPNTGGMGAIAPVEAPPEAGALLQRAVDGLREEGRPFVGVLYAGLMLTSQGPRVLEFNCRLGDPETQVLLPLLETPLLEILSACVEGRLHELEPVWRAECATCVVAAAPGYPERPRLGEPITGLEPEDPLVFQAGTRRSQDQILTAGGRVLAVTGLGPDRASATAEAYRRLARIHFPAMHYRTDIGR